MKILGIIVLYNCNLFESVSYKKCAEAGLANENFSLFVYDNSPVAQHTQSELSDYKIVYVSDTSNPGVSKAYNTGTRYAKEHGFDWVLLLDQDTDFQDNTYVEQVFSRIENNHNVLFVPQVVKRGADVFSPLPMWHHIPKGKQYEPEHSYSLKKVSIINSGMLVKVDAFFNAGGYNEKVPLDLADYQFIYRLQKKYPEFYLMDYKLVQSFSNDVDNIESLKFRFKNYCVSALHYEADFITKSDILFSMLKRCMSLLLRTKDFSFMRIMFKTIVKR